MHKQTPTIRRLAIFGIAGIAITTISLQPKVSEAKSDRFFCQSAIVRGKTVPVTYAATKALGNVPMIAWVRNDFATSVSPQQRCQAVARRF